MKKVLAVMLSLAMVISCVAMMQISSFAKSVTETALDVNFEDSTAEGYDPDGKIGSPAYAYEDNAFKFTAGNSYSSPFWNITSKLKAFAESNPDTTITVNVVAKMKSDSETASLRMLYRGAGDVAVSMSSDASAKVGTTWTEVKNSFTVVAADVASAADNAYRICFDRMPNTSTVFSIDSLKVTFTAVGNPVGVEFEVTKSLADQEAGGEMSVLIAKTSFDDDLSYLTALKGDDGKVSVSFTIYNCNDYAIQANAGVQVNNKTSWDYLTNDGKTISDAEVIEAKSSKVITATFDIDADGKALDTKGNKVSLDKVGYRINVYNNDESGFGTNKDWGLPVGTKIVVAPETNAKLDYIQTMNMWAGSKKTVDELPVFTTPDEGKGDEGTTDTPTPTPEVKVPTGFSVKYNEDFTGLNYMISSTGVFTSADVKDGELTKTYSVKNNGEETLKIRLTMQLLATKEDGGQTWAGPVAGSWVEIEPGETGEVTYTAEVENGKVTVYDNEYDIEKLFARFDIGGDGTVTVPEGTDFTVYCGQTVAEGFEKGSKNFKDSATFALVYGKVEGAGDVLPVAFIALTVVASVALIVVSKKRREEF